MTTTQPQAAQVLERCEIIDLISPDSANSADHDIQFAHRILAAAVSAILAKLQAATPAAKPLFAVAVAARKWAELQEQGHRMQSISFDGGPGGAGTIDPWGVVRWSTPAEPAQAEPMVRFCPGCGSVGPVPDEFKDCCPDGGRARMIPEPLANQCRDLFRLALDSAIAQAVELPDEREIAAYEVWWGLIDMKPLDRTFRTKLEADQTCTACHADFAHKDAQVVWALEHPDQKQTVCPVCQSLLTDQVPHE